MAQVLVNFRIDEKIKSQLEEVCEELGLNLSTAFNIFARKTIREKRIPFEVSLSENNGDIVQDEAIKAFKKIRQKTMQSKKEWTGDEINKEISLARKKGKNKKG